MPQRIPATPAELKSIGLKATLPRLRILDIFQRAATTGGARHLSAEDVYRVLLTEHLDVGLATVDDRGALTDRDERSATGHHRTYRHHQHRTDPVANTPPLTRIRHRSQRREQTSTTTMVVDGVGQVVNDRMNRQ